MQLQKLPVFALQIAKILEKHIVFQGFFLPAAFFTANHGGAGES